MYSIDKLIKKYEAARTRHTKFLSLVWKPFTYVNPNRDGLNEFLRYMDVGANKELLIKNNMPSIASRHRANKLNRMLIPSNEQWGAIDFNKKEISKGQDDQLLAQINQGDVDLATQTLFTYLDNSGLSTCGHDSMLDLNITGGAMWVESPSDNDPLRFTSIPGFSVMPEFYQGSTLRDKWYIFSASPDFIEDTYFSNNFKNNMSKSDLDFLMMAI